MTQITQNLVVGKREDVTENILLLTPQDAPMLDVLGFGESVTQVEPTWFEDEVLPDKTTATKAVVAGDATIEVAQGEVFDAGYVAKVGDELVLVTAVAGNVLTVTRGYAETVAGTAAIGDVVEFQFVEGKEGADARPARYQARTRHSNFTQIFDATIQISRTAEFTSQHGIEDLYAYEKAKEEKKLALQLEKAVINGIKYESPNGLTRQMGGIKNFVKTNVIAAANAPIDKKLLNKAFLTIAEKTGENVSNTYKIIVPPVQKLAISEIDSNAITLQRADNGRGQVVDHFVGDFGAAEIIVNPNLSADEILIFDASRAKIRPLQNSSFTHEYLGKQGDYKTGMIVGEYTLELHQEKAHARIKGLKK